MSEAVVQTQAENQGLQPVYLLYDPAKRKRKRAKRAKEGAVRGKAYIIGPRGGVAWIGPSALRYEPDPIVLYEPARRRRRARKLDPVRAGSKALVDSAIDGLGIGGVISAVPYGGTPIAGGLTVKDIGAGVVAGLYEKLYMKRGWTSAIIGFATALFTNKILNWIRGVSG